MDDYDATILIDAAPRGEAPGTLYLIEPEINKLDDEGEEVVNAHSMNSCASVTIQSRKKRLLRDQF